MLDGALVRLERHLRDHPEDEDAWLELALLAARGGDRPPVLRAPRALPRLLALWRRHPDNRLLGALVLPLLDLELVTGALDLPGEYWERSGGAGRAEDHLYDPDSGLPLRVRRPRDRAEMLWIPGGRFWRGSDEGEVDERPEQRIHVDGFYLDRYPVTVAQFLTFAEVEGEPRAAQLDVQRRSPDAPVVFVDREETLRYATWAGARLPTEAEWERAARGDDRRTYPWGDAAPDTARSTFTPSWIRRDGGAWAEALTPVDAHPAGRSPFGCEDMVGNVWETCSDRYAPRFYAGSPRENPRGPDPGGEPPEYVSWVLRGGWWGGGPETLRVSRRHARHGNWRAHDVGFRLALGLAPRQDLP